MQYINKNLKFQGREITLELLKRRIFDLKEGYRQNIAILGNKYVGKSFLLNHFANNIDDNDIVIIYLDLENKDFNYLFQKFAGSLLYKYSKVVGLPLHNELDLLLENTKERIPNTVQVINKIKLSFSKGKFFETFLGLFTLPEVFTNETSKFCVLILDEFQNLEEIISPEVFQELGRKIMTQKKCFYLFSSSYQNTAKKILSEKLSLLFGNFETILLEPFDIQNSNKFIENIVGEIKIGIQLRNFLSDFTGGHPLYLSLICNELISLSAIYKQNEIFLPLLSQSVENTIFNRWGVISRHFELVINELCQGKGNRILSSLLMSISNNKNKTDDLINDLGLSKTQISQKLNRLIELGIVEKNSNFYFIKDKLFKYWIKYIYQKRLKEVEFSSDKQERQFKEEFNKAIEKFKADSRKDFPLRIAELFHCFGNEDFDLMGRRYKLPSFREVVPSKIKHDNGVYFDVINAIGDNGNWLIVLKKDTFGENDVNAILSEYKKLEQKPNRCLIVSMSDLEENAKLKALQSKFWIWNESEINMLLNFFDKSFII